MWIMWLAFCYLLRCEVHRASDRVSDSGIEQDSAYIYSLDCVIIPTAQWCYTREATNTTTFWCHANYSWWCEQHWNQCHEQSASLAVPENRSANLVVGESQVHADPPDPPAVLPEQPSVRHSSRVTSQPDRFDPDTYGCVAEVHVSSAEPQRVTEISRRLEKKNCGKPAWLRSRLLSLRGVFSNGLHYLLAVRLYRVVEWTQICALRQVQFTNISLALLEKGLHQKEGVATDVFAQGSNLVTLRMLLSMAVIADLEMHPLDVKMAFLNGNLDEEVYLPPPTGVKVCQERCDACKKHCTV
jgi:hypothetical protein